MQRAKHVLATIAAFRLVCIRGSVLLIHEPYFESFKSFEAVS